MEVKNLSKSRKFLFVTDIHLMTKPISSMPNIIDVQQRMLREGLFPIIEKYGITDIVQTGDLVHCGIQQKKEFMQTIYIIEELKAKVDNLFMCIGNHFFLDILNNPELYCIQPSSRYRAGLWKGVSSRIIETPDIIKCGPLQINLAHFEKDDINKKYTFDRMDDTTYNVTVFHDDIYGHHNETLPTRIQSYYNNIDLAVHGHIHIANEPFSIDIGSKSVSVYIPGSMSLTSSLKEEYHEKVILPIVSVSEDGKVTIENVEVPIFSEDLTILKTSTSEEDITLKNIKKDIKENKLTEVEFDIDGLNIKAELTSIKDYLESVGVGDDIIEIARRLSVSPITYSNYKRKENDENESDEL